MTKPPAAPSRLRHAVAIDADKCSFCEVCTRDCPTGALGSERAEGKLRLWFRPRLCTGCPGRQSCAQLCPEKAVTLTAHEAAGPAEGPPEVVLLAQSEMVRCAYCGEDFAPQRKLDTVAAKKSSHEVVRDLCPLCRRTELVVRFIDEKRDPRGRAEYRAAHDILRRAGYERPRKKRKGY